MQQFQRLRWRWDWLRLLLILRAVEVMQTQFTANNLQDAGASAAAAAARRAQNAPPYPTYFFMDLNGSYKYAFDTGSGIASEQSANQANEVTGQYSYFENGVPYMVKYKAGVQGYQAEIIPRDNLQVVGPMAGNAATQAQQSSGKAVFEPSLLRSSAPNLPPTPPQATTNAVPSDIRPQFRPADGPALAQAAGDADGGGGMVATLQFVQDAMETMRNRPLQVSFTSQQRFGLPATNVAANSGSFRLLPQNIAATTVSNAEIQQINALADNSVANTAAPAAAQQLRRQPYEFSYLSQQSSRTESADKSGNVVGKYSYYDDAGFHDLTYKAGDDIGFVVLGGSLADRQDGLANSISAASSPPPTAGNVLPNDSPFLIVNVQQQPNVNYNYRVVTDAPSIDRRTRRNSRSAASAAKSLSSNSNNNNNSNNINIKPDNNGRSLRKFRRNANW